MGQDETGQREEQVHAKATNPHDVAHDRYRQQAEDVERPLQVVGEHPERGDEANPRQLADEHAHVDTLGSPSSLVGRSRANVGSAVVAAGRSRARTLRDRPGC